MLQIGWFCRVPTTVTAVPKKRFAVVDEAEKKKENDNKNESTERAKETIKRTLAAYLKEQESAIAQRKNDCASQTFHLWIETIKW